MVTKQSDSNSLAIQANNFGGLNTTASPVNMPLGDFSLFTNVDTDISGRVKKRKGTVIRETLDGSLGNVTSLISATGLELLLVIIDSGLTLYNLSNGRFEPLTTVFGTPVFEDVFVNEVPSQISSTVISGKQLSVLYTSQYEVPVQFTFYEQEVVAVASEDTYRFENITEILGFVDFNTRVFINKAVVSSDDYALTSVVINGIAIPQIQFDTAPNAGDIITIFMFVWNWLAESQRFYGDNFQASVPRFSASVADQNVQVPTSILSNLDLQNELLPYGIRAFYQYNGWFTTDIDEGGYLFTSNRPSPISQFTYAFSNGALYSSDLEMKPSPFVILFGANAGEYEIKIPAYKFFGQGSVGAVTTVYFVNHQFITNDRVTVTQTHPIAGTSTVDAVVTKIDNNRFSLSVGVTPLVPSVVFVAGDVNVANNTIEINPTVIAAYATGTSVLFTPLLSSASITGVSYFTPYFIRRVSATPLVVTLETQVQSSTEIDITAVSGTSFIWPNLDVVISRKALNNVDFIKLHKVKVSTGKVIPADIVLDKNLTRDITLNQLKDDFDTDNTSTVDNLGYTLFTTNSVNNFVTDDTTPASFITLASTIKPNDLISITGVSAVKRSPFAVERIIVDGGPINSTGHYIPLFGIYDYCDYKGGNFPGLAVMYQQRLVLSGFSNSHNTLLFSAILKSIRDSENLYMCQIDDLLEGVDSDPFDITLNEETSSPIIALRAWQENLFVFTNNSVYRSYNPQQIISPTNRNVVLVSSKGAVSAESIAITEREIFFLSQSGLYSIPLVEASEYRGEEISLKIRSVFDRQLTFAFLQYSRQDSKLWMGISYSSSVYADQLYVFDTLTKSWSKYTSYRNFQLASLTISSTNRIIGVSLFEDGLQLIEFNQSKYLDFMVETAITAETDELSTEKLLETQTMSSGKYMYKLSTPFSLHREVDDIAVWIEDTRLVLGTDYNKIANQYIQILTDFEDNDILTVSPNPLYSYFGTGMYLDDIPVRLTENSFADSADFLTATLTREMQDFCFQFSYLSGNRIIISEDDSQTCSVNADSGAFIIGYTYPAEILSPLLTQEAFFVNKRTEFIYLLFHIDNNRDAVIQLSTEPGFDNRNYTLQQFNANVSILIDNQEPSYNEYTLTDLPNFDYREEWAVFKSPIQRIGYGYQLYVWSNDVYSWELAAWQVKATSQDGSSLVSGES